MVAIVLLGLLALLGLVAGVVRTAIVSRRSDRHIEHLDGDGWERTEAGIAAFVKSDAEFAHLLLGHPASGGVLSLVRRPTGPTLSWVSGRIPAVLLLNDLRRADAAVPGAIEPPYINGPSAVARPVDPEHLAPFVRELLAGRPALTGERGLTMLFTENGVARRAP